MTWSGRAEPDRQRADRVVQADVDRLNGEPGKTGKVEVERQSIDELRAEIAQLQTMLTLKK